MAFRTLRHLCPNFPPPPQTLHFNHTELPLILDPPSSRSARRTPFFIPLRAAHLPHPTGLAYPSPRQPPQAPRAGTCCSRACASRHRLSLLCRAAALSGLPQNLWRLAQCVAYDRNPVSFAHTRVVSSPPKLSA